MVQATYRLESWTKRADSIYIAVYMISRIPLYPWFPLVTIQVRLKLLIYPQQCNSFLIHHMLFFEACGPNLDQRTNNWNCPTWYDLLEEAFMMPLYSIIWLKDLGDKLNVFKVRVASKSHSNGYPFQKTFLCPYVVFTLKIWSLITKLEIWDTNVK